MIPFIILLTLLVPLRLAVDTRCSYHPNGHMIEDPQDCRLYSVCHGGRAFAKSCWTGSRFSLQYKKCIPRDCLPCFCYAYNPPVTCEGKYEGEAIRDPDDCKGYFQCIRGNPMKRICASYQKFDSNKGKCVRGNCPPCKPCPPRPTTVRPLNIE